MKYNMKQEDKDLLLQDLCSRLPYGVILNCCNTIGEKLTCIDENGLINHDYDINECKPYLFPLSSMTEGQRKEFDDLTKVLHEFMKNHAKGNDVTERFFYTQIELWKLKTDWLNKNHFDYRGLIPKELANDATGLNIY